jgi:hypothetical protein
VLSGGEAAGELQVAPPGDGGGLGVGRVVETRRPTAGDGSTGAVAAVAEGRGRGRRLLGLVVGGALADVVVDVGRVDARQVLVAAGARHAAAQAERGPRGHEAGHGLLVGGAAACRAGRAGPTVEAVHLIGVIRGGALLL